jgi:hypothetical protein
MCAVADLHERFAIVGIGQDMGRLAHGLLGEESQPCFPQGLAGLCQTLLQVKRHTLSL